MVSFAPSFNPNTRAGDRRGEVVPPVYATGSADDSVISSSSLQHTTGHIGNVNSTITAPAGSIHDRLHATALEGKLLTAKSDSCQGGSVFVTKSSRYSTNATALGSVRDRDPYKASAKAALFNNDAPSALRFELPSLLSPAPNHVNAGNTDTLLDELSNTTMSNSLSELFAAATSSGTNYTIDAPDVVVPSIASSSVAFIATGVSATGSVGRIRESHEEDDAARLLSVESCAEEVAAFLAATTRRKS